MRKSKIIDVLKTFSEDELKKFKDFVYSPFHNRNKNVIKLFDLIRKYYPSFESDKLEKQKIYAKLFPGKNYNDVVMRILISDLLQLSEEYMAYINFRKKPLHEIKYLLHETKERKLDSLHKSNLNSAEKYLAAPGRINYNHYFELFDVETSRVDFLIARDRQMSSGLNVLKQGEYLINFFLFNVFNIAHELNTHEGVLNVKFDFNLVEEILESIDFKKIFETMAKNKYPPYPVLLIYYNMYLSCLDEKNPEYYFQMKKLIEANLEYFETNEKVNLYIILESMCVTQLSFGKEEFYRELFGIYKSMLFHNIYIHADKDFFQVNLFRNMFFVAIVLKEYTWAQDFLKNYIGNLSPEERNDMLHYSNAVLLFEKGNYEDALAEITKVRFRFFIYKYEVRVWMLKIYYEQKSFEPAISLIDSFTHFLTNNKRVPESEKERFGNFLRYLNILIRIRTGSADLDNYDLKKDIHKTSHIISKRWLLKKAEELY